MLQSLNIENYALINKLEIQFYKGFSIITGETGAGKSILLDALGLVMGQRADINVLKDKEKKCVVEAVFDIAEYKLKSFFEQNELDYDSQTIIRRQILPNGKSRAFVNDNPVNLNLLKDLCLQLIDIHSQHENLQLSNNAFQLKVVDIMANHQSLLSDYEAIYQQYKTTQKELSHLIDEVEKARKEYDFFQHQFDELDKAKLVAGEVEELESELATLTHAEEIKLNLLKTSQNLQFNEINVIDTLKECMVVLQNIQQFYPAAQQFAERIEVAYIDLKDIANETTLLGNDVDYNQERAEFVNERLDLIFSLQKKNRVDNVQSLIDIRNLLATKLNDIFTADERIAELNKQIDALHSNALNLATQITKNRKIAGAKIEKHIIGQLKQLGIPNTSFHIEISQLQQLSKTGNDNVNFLFSANKNVPLQDITKVASGGELSRVMLCIKALISQYTALPTIIFDEIDTGVSGDIADKMGNILKEMANNMQVMNITHLPQIASKGHFHYLVYKQDNKNSTFSSIKLLNSEERIIEIAKMLSGKNLTDAALNNAKALLGIS